MEAEIVKDPFDQTKYEKRFASLLENHIAGGGTASSFIAVLADLGVRIRRSTLYGWLQTRPDFAEALEIGKARRLRSLEALANAKLTNTVTPAMAEAGIKKIDGRQLRFELEYKFKEEYSRKISIDATNKTPPRIIFQSFRTREEVEEFDRKQQLDNKDE